MIATAKLPGPLAASAAISPATPSSSKPAHVARKASASTRDRPQSSAEPAQPIAVTLAISGWPLAMAATRVPSDDEIGLAGQRDDESMSDGTHRRAPRCCRQRRQAPEIRRALSRTTLGRSLHAAPARIPHARAPRSISTGSSTQGSLLSVARLHARCGPPRGVRRRMCRD